jgi:hypothetical protein
VAAELALKVEIEAFLNSAGLTLQTDLADHPPAGQTANNIDHQDTASSVTAVAVGSSGTPNSSSTPKSSSTVPEFTSVAAITILLIIATASIACQLGSLKIRDNWQSKLR